MLKGQSKAKLEKYNKKDEFIIMFIIKIIDDILDENIFDIFEYIFIKEDKYTLEDIEYVLFLSSSTLKRKVKLMNKIIKIVNEKVVI